MVIYGVFVKLILFVNDLVDPLIVLSCLSGAGSVADHHGFQLRVVIDKGPAELAADARRFGKDHHRFDITTGAVDQVAIMLEKFLGTMPTTTPIGSRRVKAV